MSSMEAGIHWFIARDGRQHGPVSDMEMRKLVELGHLRHSDLLWRQGFPDWRPAPAVFAAAPPAALAAQPMPERPRQQSASPSLMPRFEATAGRGATSGAAATAAAAAAANGSAMAQGWPGGPQTGHQPGLQSGSLNGPSIGMQGAAQGSRTAQPVRDVQNDPRPGPQFIPAPAQGASEPRFDAVPAPAYRYSNDRNSKGSTPARSKAPRAVALLVGVAAMAGGGWYAAKNHGPAIKEFIASKTAGKSKPAAASATTATTAVSAPEQKPAAAVPAALTPPPPEAVQAIEATLQKAGYWKIIASEFPDWYREKVDAAARLSAEGKSEAEVSKSLVQSLVELRRSQSEAALAASSETLKSLATAFKNTVTRMAKEGTPTCMAFIMSGESNDAVVPVITDPAKNAEVNAHLLAVFNAIVEGRKAATAHADPADGDYKLLVAELVKGGWTQAELELFADPKGASRTTPERYCQMMQDFFAAHLSIPDAAVQDRLLHRTLKLVVAG